MDFNANDFFDVWMVLDSAAASIMDILVWLSAIAAVTIGSSYVLNDVDSKMSSMTAPAGVALCVIVMLALSWLFSERYNVEQSDQLLALCVVGICIAGYRARCASVKHKRFLESGKQRRDLVLALPAMRSLIAICLGASCGLFLVSHPLNDGFFPAIISTALIIVFLTKSYLRYLPESVDRNITRVGVRSEEALCGAMFLIGMVAAFFMGIRSETAYPNFISAVIAAMCFALYVTCMHFFYNGVLEKLRTIR